MQIVIAICYKYTIVIQCTQDLTILLFSINSNHWLTKNLHYKLNIPSCSNRAMCDWYKSQDLGQLLNNKRQMRVFDCPKIYGTNEEEKDTSFKRSPCMLRLFLYFCQSCERSDKMSLMCQLHWTLIRAPATFKSTHQPGDSAGLVPRLTN